MNHKKILINSLLLLLSVSTGIVVSELVLRALPNEFYYYRPHEILSAYNDGFRMVTYKKNSKVTMTMPYGDLVAMDRHADKSIAEPRKVTFATDSYGFRNNADYHGQRYVLVGDSFVVANGDSQEDTLNSQLKRDYGIDAYNLAAPGGLTEYAKLIKKFCKDNAGDFKMLVFFFEGNDFPRPGEEDADAGPSYKKITSDRSSLYRKMQDILKQSYIRRVFVRIRKGIKSEARYRKTGEHVTRVYKIKGKDARMGFYDNYIDTTLRPECDGGAPFLEELKSISDNIAYIFFIPTKYRVYRELIEGDGGAPLPNAQWECLSAMANKLNIRCINLTQPLIEESKKILKEDKYTYWRDDTHWNKYGISTAAMVVYETLKENENNHGGGKR